MKKLIAITLLTLSLLSINCDRQKALDRVIADPQMKSYLLGEMLKSEGTKAQLTDSIFADTMITGRYLDKLISDENGRADLLNKMLRADPTGDWIIKKLSEDPNLAAKMRQLPK
jgi:hypothetical protein